MRTTYNQVAGQSVERLAALSDGVFAVAMTLLVLDLHGPAAEAIRSGQRLWNALQPLATSPAVSESINGWGFARLGKNGPQP